MHLTKKTFPILSQRYLTPQIIYRWKANEKRYISILIVLQKSEKRKRKNEEEKNGFLNGRLSIYDSLHHDGLKNVYVPWQKYNILGDIRGFLKIFFFVFLFRFSLFRETF